VIIFGSTLTHTTPREISRRLGLRIHVVLAWIASGELRAANVTAKRNGQRPRWRIAEADLESFLSGRAGGPKPAPVARPRRTRDESVTQYFPEK